MTSVADDDLGEAGRKIVDAAIAGETVVVTRGGNAVAEVRSVAPAPRRFVPREDLLKLAARLPHLDTEQFRADVDEWVDQSI